MEISKELLEDLYFNKNMSQPQIAKHLFVSQSVVSVNFTKYGFKSRRIWNEADVEYLEDNWGKWSVECLAKNLNKSVHAVNAKAKRLGLGGVNKSSEYIVAAELAKAIGYDSKTVYRWINEKGLIARKRKLSNKYFWRIDLKDFWDWALDNKDLIDWRKIKSNALGLEPAWVADVRKNSYNCPANLCARWTEPQDKMLIMYWNIGKSIKEISELMSRSQSGIKKRAARLGLPKKIIEIPWKSVEDSLLIEMYSVGLSDSGIAEELGRSRSSVRYRRNKLIKLGILKRDTKTPTKVDLASIQSGLDNKPVTL